MTISSITSFAGVHGRVTNSGRQVYFLRCIGQNQSYIDDIKKADLQLLKDKNCVYNRISALPAFTDTSLATFYTEKYTGMFSGKKDSSWLKKSYDADINDTFLRACKDICELNKSCVRNYNNTIEKNLIVSLMYWTDAVLYDMLQNIKIKHCKLIYSGKVGNKEFSFLYLASLMGVDVLILLPAGDVKIPSALAEKSASFVIGSTADIKIPELEKEVFTDLKEHIMKHPARRKPEQTAPFPRAVPASAPVITAPAPSTAVNRTPARRELSYEEIAKLAASVVMISVKDNSGKVFATGSGIAINNSGFILTNCHVASGGSSFAVSIENDDNVYETTEIIKYHSVLDLALIRIDRKLTPIKLYSQQEELVRGQKVIAIGSPMGMFNSVSDGIISGFRKMDGVDTIQFTAPISPGSSGGAVFNTYGELIGISTAGIDGGQNLNLAVSYKLIAPFISGFTR